MELTERQWLTIAAGRQAMHQTIAAAYPGDAMPLFVTGITAAFVQILAASLGEGELIALVNDQLRGAGLQLVKLRRN
jgi:hypothetical protein